jgi:hypothetical protein
MTNSTIDNVVKNRELVVLPGSPLVNLRKKEVEAKYNFLQFGDHYHVNARRRSEGNRIPYYKNMIIIENMALKIASIPKNAIQELNLAYPK